MCPSCKLPASLDEICHLSHIIHWLSAVRRLSRDRFGWVEDFNRVLQGNHDHIQGLLWLADSSLLIYIPLELLC